MSLLQEAGPSSSGGDRYELGSAASTSTSTSERELYELDSLVTPPHPLRRRIGGHENMTNVMFELGVPRDPGLADVDLLVNRLLLQPDLAARFEHALSQIVSNANFDPPDGNFNLPISHRQYSLLATVMIAYDAASRERIDDTSSAASPSEVDLYEPESPVSPPDASRSRIVSHENMTHVMSELGVPRDPRLADVDLLVNRLLLQPDLAARFEHALSQIVSNANFDPPDGNFNLPISHRQYSLLATVMIAYDAASRERIDATNRMEDIDQQQDPLGSEIQAWSRQTGVILASPHAFDREDNAEPFARMLSRLRENDVQAPQETLARTREQVASVLRAIEQYPDLRKTVFSLAVEALGSCIDNLAEGFSKVVLEVDNHEMKLAVERGDIDAARLNGWAASLFRLSLLETAVLNHMDRKQGTGTSEERKNVADESVETMVHAKEILGPVLGLPESTVSTSQFGSTLSILQEADLNLLREVVLQDARAPGKLGRFLLKNETWRVGMKALYPKQFQDQKERHDDNAFYDLDFPADGNLVAQVEYAEKARLVNDKNKDEEDALLLSLAFEGSRQVAAEPQVRKQPNHEAGSSRSQ